MTLVEAVVAAALFAGLTGALFTALSGGRRTATAAADTAGVAEIELAAERFLEDVRQMGYDPSTAVDLVVHPHGTSFHATRFDGAGIALRRIRWRAVAAKGGLNLERTAEDAGGKLRTERLTPVPLRAVAFGLVVDARFGGRSLRLALTAAGAAHTVLARLPVAPAWGDPQRDPACKVLVPGALLAIED